MKNLDRRRAHAVWTARMVATALSQPGFPFRSATAIRQVQERRIGSMVAYACAHVPYYRETMRRLVLGPEDFHSLEDLARLPIVEREQLQRDPEYFVSDHWPPETCVRLQSGGTTGAPITVFCDSPSIFAEAAYYERLRSVIARATGRRIHYRQASIGPSDGSTARTVRALRARTMLPKNLRVRLQRFPLLSPAELVGQLNSYRPHVISAYGSYLDVLFTHIRERRPAFRAPRVVVYGADAMSTAVREWVQTYLGIQVLSDYGAIEAAHIGFECERHRGYHLNIDLYPVRLMTARGGLATAGTTGEVIVSNLVNRATVLLNYRLGDLATMVEEPCPCGRNLPLLSYLDRTKASWLDLGAGQVIHAELLWQVVHRDEDIWRFQVLQQRRRELLLRIVPRPHCDEGAAAGRIARNLRQRLPEGVTVRVEFVAEIPRAPSGKVQPIVAYGGQPEGRGGGSDPPGARDEEGEHA